MLGQLYRLGLHTRRDTVGQQTLSATCKDRRTSAKSKEKNVLHYAMFQFYDNERKCMACRLTVSAPLKRSQTLSADKVTAGNVWLCFQSADIVSKAK